MTLDEAIKHCEEKAEELKKDADYLDVPYGMDASAKTKCLNCAEEHKQLAEWLKDYKRLLEERPHGEILVEHCIEFNSRSSECRSCYSKCTWFKCSKCSCAVEKDDRFCRHCGADLRAKEVKE